MKQIPLLLAFLCVIQFSVAQNIQKERTDSVCNLVKKYFNEKSSAGLYGLTGETFRKVLSSEDFGSVCEKNLFPLGEIKECLFENSSQGVSKYKAVFTSVNLTLLLGLDTDDKIETLLFKPYTE